MQNEQIQELFSTHPTVDLFFVTSDDQAFFTQEMADAHGQKLKDRQVVSIKRDEPEAVQQFEAGDLDGGWSETVKELTPAEKGQITKALNAQKSAAAKTEVAETEAEPAAQTPAVVEVPAATIIEGGVK